MAPKISKSPTAVASSSGLRLATTNTSSSSSNVTTVATTTAMATERLLTVAAVPTTSSLREATLAAVMATSSSHLENPSTKTKAGLRPPQSTVVASPSHKATELLPRTSATTFRTLSRTLQHTKNLLLPTRSLPTNNLKPRGLGLANDLRRARRAVLWSLRPPSPASWSTSSPTSIESSFRAR